MKPAPAILTHGPAAEAGPILSDRAGDTTTVWRDGEVVREDRFGRARGMPHASPVFGYETEEPAA